MARTIHEAESIKLISRGVFLELMRKKEFYVVLVLMVIYFVAMLAVSVVGVENDSTAAFLLNLGMTAAWYSAHILTLILVARQIPDEIENRTLYPMLAKPLERRTLLIGKWAACTLCGYGCLLLLIVLAWVPVPKPDEVSFGLLIQLLVFSFVSLSMTAALALFFSVVTPRGVGLVVVGLMLFGGGKFINVVSGRLENFPMEGIWVWVLNYIPNFDKLNVVTRYTDGAAAVDIGTFVAAILYGLCFSAAALALSAWVFERRPL